MQYQYFTTIAQFKAEGLAVTADVQLADVEPYLFRAEQLYVLPALGAAFLDVVHATEPPALLKLLRQLVGSYAVRSFASTRQRTNTPAGTAPLPGVKENANTEKLIAQHVAALEASALESLELVLQHLEQYPAEYPTWHASRYCTVYPRRYFQSYEQLSEYPGAPTTRSAFRLAQGTLAAITAQRILPVVGAELNTRLLTELDDVAHEQVLGYIRTALATYYVYSDHEQLHAADCALVELRQLLQRSPDDYPEFLSSPSYVPTDISPTVTANAYCAFY